MPRRAHEQRHTSSVPGRPAAYESRNVREDIVRAAETCLTSKKPQQISINEIASLAGTRSTMVHYYFGGKDGLLIEIIRRGLDEVQQGFLRTHGAILRNESNDPTRSMIKAFADIYNERPAFCRVVIAEVSREDSPVKCYVMKQWQFFGKTMLLDVLSQLSATGYYRRGLDGERTYEMLHSVIFFPLVLKHPLAKKQTDNYFDDQWVDFVSSVFDSYLRERK